MISSVFTGMVSWYPTQLSMLPAWYNTFAIECNNYKVLLASVLTAGVVTQVQTNATLVAAVMNLHDEASNYAQAVTEFRDIILGHDNATTMPVSPVPPAAFVAALGSISNVEYYTRVLVAQIKAHPACTAAIREAMGIEGTAGGTGTPSLIITDIGSGLVEIKANKAGYSVIGLNMSRFDDPATQVAIITTSPFIHNLDLVTPGIGEVRIYTAQGIQNNLPHGPMSAPVSVAVLP